MKGQQREEEKVKGKAEASEEKPLETLSGDAAVEQLPPTLPAPVEEKRGASANGELASWALAFRDAASDAVGVVCGTRSMPKFREDTRELLRKMATADLQTLEEKAERMAGVFHVLVTEIQLERHRVGR